MKLLKFSSQEKKMVIGEFLGSTFISFWGLGFVIPFAVLGYVSNMFEFSVWFGIAFAFTVIIFAPISGAHVNPSVTVAWAIFGGFEKKLIVPYWIAQILGWGVGVVPYYIIFGETLAEWSLSTGGNSSTLFYCSTDSLIPGALLEIFLTMLLTFGIFFLLDEQLPNRPTKAGFPWAIGILISLLIALGGGFTGTCINPARDLGPRIIGYIYGSINGYDVSSIFAGGQWIMYIVAPMIGAILGGAFHYGVIRKLLPAALPDNNDKS